MATSNLCSCRTYTICATHTQPTNLCHCVASFRILIEYNEKPFFDFSKFLSIFVIFWFDSFAGWQVCQKSVIDESLRSGSIVLGFAD